MNVEPTAEERARHSALTAIWPTLRDYPSDESWTWSEVAMRVIEPAMNAYCEYLAAQPRTVAVPPEDRARKWRDSRGATWEWIPNLDWSDGDQYGHSWLGMLRVWGQMTDAGPA